MESYKPSAVVLQSGTDSLQGDKLGCFNLSMRGDISVDRYHMTNVNQNVEQGMPTVCNLSNHLGFRHFFSVAAATRCET